MRARVAESWHRSAAAGVDPDSADVLITLPSDMLREYREAHPLARVLPILDDLLGQTAVECESLMAVADAQGQLLWVRGHSAVLRQAESIGFVEGSNWEERLAGTNAPGLVLALNEPVHVAGAEHFRHTVRPWSCAAAPIHDPQSGSILGVLDVTGAARAIGSQALAMVRATARMVEAEMARDLQSRNGIAMPHASIGFPRARLDFLGRTDALLTMSPGGHSRSRTVRLSPRHSEILLLLTGTPAGLSGPELGIQLYEEDMISSTLRAEMTRLRSLLGEDLLPSRPYRLAAEVTSDWLAVQAQLAAGDVAGAVRSYRGPILPRSVAPGVCRIRDSVQFDLREAVLRSGRPELMSWWTTSGWGTDDYEMWLMQSQALDPRSPLLPIVRGQLHRLDISLGAAADLTCTRGR
ncbi:transcriptional regulator [Flexivirga endophytica]|uniref:Transcriptional regulator n=2 Tax=Flexivirga endophytica TaxID=1849103 RepID=A0A916WZE8_9MICO|nr:transcriptional regulator [Flexivirga endophytica]GHB60336.1 transcriptional regulator [Flexivirga endophytica]